ncbi:MAG TPA: YaiI/YqxD family protein [Crenotrichaceae bacterium]|nr:YaiI/YqxD family protein [Crenotrichaceae bacterium]
MKIWVDADACPVTIKEILFRAANRTGIQLTLVANQALHIPPSPYIHMLQVKPGFDVADDEIVNRVNKGDLVITTDIPLAALVLEKHGHALSPRGDLYTVDNIKECLDMRNFMEALRSSGTHTGGPPPFNTRDQHAFSNQLDKWLNRFS